MNFSATCPSCGAALELTEQTERVVCPFCSTPFDVDLSKAQAEFHKAEPAATSADVFVPQDADIITPPAAGPDADPPYAAPQPGAFSTTPGQSFDLPIITQVTTRLVGPRLWFGLAIATIVIFCLSCLCLMAVVRGVFGYAIGGG